MVYVSPIFGPRKRRNWMNVQTVGATPPRIQVAKPAVRGVDRDGDTDNSTVASDSLEAAKAASLKATGVGQSVNATA